VFYREVIVLKKMPVVILTIFLAACTSPSLQAGQSAQIQEQGPLPGAGQTEQGKQPVKADLEDLGPAPELANEVWLNTDQPLRLQDLRGNVVLLDMWTFG